MDSKIAIIGTGMVGASFAYAATITGLANEIVLVNRTREAAEGEAMDLNHCLSFVEPVNIHAGDYEDCRDAQLIVVAAGAASEPGQTRLELASKNADITRKVIRQVMQHARDPVLLMVSNPVDVLTYVAVQESGLPPERIIGSGTVLDTSRFRYLLASNCNIDTRNVHGYVIGEHGDSEVALWSRVNFAGVFMEQFCATCDHDCPADIRERIENDVRTAAYQIISKKGATYYAIGLAMKKIAKVVINDQKSALTVSTLTQGHYGLEDVCLSLPCIVGRNGIEHIIDAELAGEEQQKLLHSAAVLRQSLGEAGCL